MSVTDIQYTLIFNSIYTRRGAL